MYQPDNWVVLKVAIDPDDIHYRVLGGWSGGYLSGDSWRLNSGITKVEDSGDYFLFYGSSGSVYKCHKDSYGVRMNCAHVVKYYEEKYPDQVEILSENTNWLEMRWGI